MKILYRSLVTSGHDKAIEDERRGSGGAGSGQSQWGRGWQGCDRALKKAMAGVKSHGEEI